MKYLLVLAVIVVAIHVWRRNRREEMAQSRPPSQPRAAVGPPQDMVRCAHCGLHLPKADAIGGSDGDYCSPAHRRAGPARS